MGFLVSISIVFVSFFLVPFWIATGFGALTAVVGGTYSARVLAGMLSEDRVRRLIRRVLLWRRRG